MKLLGSWETNIPCLSSLKYGYRGKTETENLSEEPSVKHSKHWKNITFDEVMSSVLIHFKSLRHSESLALGEISGLAKPVSSLMLSLSEFNSARTMEKIGFNLREVARNGNKKEAHELLLRELRHENCWKRYKKLKTLF